MSESWTKQLTDIAQFYSDLITRYGHNPRACDYGRAESQQIKFKTLAQVMPIQGKQVLDVGCGFADFADYLYRSCGVLDYEGIDITPRMIEEAHRLRPHLSLKVLDILTENPEGSYDLVTANGIFYLLNQDAELYMQRLIAKMYELSSNAVAFNSLSSWAENQEDGEFYADPLTTVQFCRTLTPWVVLRHDYLPHDFTIYMYKR
jgi:SAM-dependent methyltransferase